jgi:hypothetical protein
VVATNHKSRRIASVLASEMPWRYPITCSCSPDGSNLGVRKHVLEGGHVGLLARRESLQAALGERDKLLVEMVPAMPETSVG